MKNLIYHRYTTYISIKQYFIREAIEIGEVEF